jgi:hypothetical protein
MAGLDAARRDELLAALRDAIGLDPDPLVPELLIMTGRVSAVNRSAQASSTKRV